MCLPAPQPSIPFSPPQALQFPFQSAASWQSRLTSGGNDVEDMELLFFTWQRSCFFRRTDRGISGRNGAKLVGQRTGGLDTRTQRILTLGEQETSGPRSWMQSLGTTSRTSTWSPAFSLIPV